MIGTAAELDAWYDAAAARADASNSNNRNQFDAAVAAADPLFTPEFTDEAVDLFETAGIINNNVFAQMLNAVRGQNPNTIGRLEQRELLIATLLDSGSVPVNVRPGKGAAYNDAGFYLKDTNPNANENAFISHWAKAFGINRADAAILLTETITDLEEVGALNSDYTDFAMLAPVSVQLPTIEFDADGNPIPFVVVES